MTNRILLIEDDASGRELAVFNLKKAGYEVTAVGNGDAGLKRLAAEAFELVITDVKMPGISGIDVLRKIKESYDNLPVIIITAYADVELAVEAMKLGAQDFLGKPFSRDHLLLVVEKALSHHAMISELHQLRQNAVSVERPILYQSETMAIVLQMTDRFAKSDASVLVTGESGTGKELIARRIHGQSDRALGPFVPINLAAIPAELVESELFGHKKGAFTGATKDRLGKFPQASGGTIFLDEIAELPLPLQGKLLRVLQEKVVDSVGSDSPTPVDVRVVAATNRNLEQEVAEGRFRTDLFYRINVVQIEIPALRARIEDIELLASQFIERFSDGRTLDIPNEIFHHLKRHHWPGNIRELENVCQRLVLLAPENQVRVEDLPFIKKSSPNDSADWLFSGKPLPQTGISLMDIEKSIIEKVLQLQNGNVSQAANFLQIPRHVLAYRMEKFGISK
ncbi:MAG: sigma-54-dependent Fis family transcriptional regulator [Deltaproteobacteria bacterium]|nr:sigma-54-dependent Fis family transcriptional regulator [Deltaproteobacteria bacterium]MBN2671730.1 sigma-54-dependent Fis family transcriptional regulator [Deltaproteobacteria bacterium]